MAANDGQPIPWNEIGRIRFGRGARACDGETCYSIAQRQPASELPRKPGKTGTLDPVMEDGSSSFAPR